MNPNERISKIIEYSKLSSSEFADNIEVPRSSISHIISGRNKPSLDFLIKVKKQFPELEWEWLITGQGKMMTEKEALPHEEPAPKTPSLPDLFSIIEDESFGKENETEIVMARKSHKLAPSTHSTFIDDSKQLKNIAEQSKSQKSENQSNKIKRIVLFFENGTFESFEP